ncbi:Coenzyme F420 hydrogenase/dehydrogenase, beta subunit C-terminal domain [bacterium]|nr:Coenzyme F420 hydrogenase/dehydrogenase, beta subunit C-terminal domain [bacterium]
MKTLQDQKTKQLYSFDNLLEEVVEMGLCNRCGGCVSFCSADRIGALRMNKEGFPEYLDREKCLECGICYLVCPQTHVLKNEVRETFGWKPPIGLYQDVLSARSTDPEILKVGTDGGVVTSILLYMLEHNIIDGAVVSRKTGLLSRQPIIATTREEIIQAAGSQWSETQHLERMGDEYTTFVSTIPIIRKFKPTNRTKLAVVGTPCQIETIRKMQVLKILPSDLIIFTIGLFCMQSFSFSELMGKKFAKDHIVNLEDIDKVNIKEDFMLKMKSGVTIHVPLEEIETIARPACLCCTDFANDFADISVGGLGSPKGYTTVLIRTIDGKKIYTGALNEGYVESRNSRDLHESLLEKSKQLSLVAEYTLYKIERAEKQLKKMLEKE